MWDNHLRSTEHRNASVRAWVVLILTPPLFYPFYSRIILASWPHNSQHHTTVQSLFVYCVRCGAVPQSQLLLLLLFLLALSEELYPHFAMFKGFGFIYQHPTNQPNSHSHCSTLLLAGCLSWVDSAPANTTIRGTMQKRRDHGKSKASLIPIGFWLLWSGHLILWINCSSSSSLPSHRDVVVVYRSIRS